MKKILSYILVVLASSTFLSGQDFVVPLLSPNAKTTQQFSTSSIGIDYSRPSARGRVIFGNLVPFGKAWRTGANASTKLTFGEDLNFGGVPVKAGTYSMYSIPTEDEWTIVLNSNLKASYPSDMKDEDNVASIKVKSIKTTNKIETLTISVDNITTTSATLSIAWENTLISIPIVADNHERILSYLEKELNKTNPIYQKAANYYLEHDYKLEDALVYINKAIEGYPNGYWLYNTKAKICVKLNKKDEAIEAAETAYQKTIGTDSEKEYKANLELIKQSFSK